VHEGFLRGYQELVTPGPEMRDLGAFGLRGRLPDRIGLASQTSSPRRHGCPPLPNPARTCPIPILSWSLSTWMSSRPSPPSRRHLDVSEQARHGERRLANIPFATCRCRRLRELRHGGGWVGHQSTMWRCPPACPAASSSIRRLGITAGREFFHANARESRPMAGCGHYVAAV
jgi:hypothetical protein